LHTTNDIQYEAALGDALSAVVTDVDFSFSVERPVGRRYSTLSTSYESASTSKLVTAVIILRLVEQGYIKLTYRPQDWIPIWPITANAPL
jgi:CubicO group peptidase (beta-lactamase class C family)